VKRVLILLVRGYQFFLRPIMPPLCRFLPSCSDYMIEALRKRGVVVGLYLGTRRLIRCNPFGGAGYDPVPERNDGRTPRGPDIYR
jgi:putative membrane protein insertion efficiency factor